LTQWEYSAGGLVVRDGELLVIVPRKRGPDGERVLGLPKGHPDGDETPLEAAIREVREETGIEVEPLADHDLGEISYTYARKGRLVPKRVRFFLFSYRGGSTEDHDDEVEEVRWLSLARAADELSYDGEREMARRAIARLGAHRSAQVDGGE
jgi:8-oxo-dGTP pyrophosphatase MutT (NUDIX family)